MKESQIQSLFSKKVDKSFNCAYELKLVKKTSMPFNAVREEQIISLSAVKHTGYFQKITDFPYSSSNVRFASGKGFDCFTLKGSAYVAICFYKPRKPKILYLIDIDDFVEEMKVSTRKSLTEERAKEISTSNVILK
jgi:hypothetical protein